METTQNPATSGPATLDVARLQQYLSSRLPGLTAPLKVTPLVGGQSNPTFKLETPSAAYVLRTKPGPVAMLVPSAHAIEREFRIIRALAPTGVPVPPAHVLCEDESVIGSAFYVMGFVEGRVLWDQALPGMTRKERAAIYDEMMRVIALLHGVDVAAAGLDDFGRPGAYIERQISRWARQYLASVTEPNPAMDRLIEWLPKNIPASARDDSQRCVVHGDYRLDNLVFHPTEPRILAVLDWELSTTGHPLADFAYHCMAWYIPPGAVRGMGGLDHASLGIPDEADYVRRYSQLTGRAFPIDARSSEWKFYVAYNLFRITAIVQGIAKRVADGTAASPSARETAACATPLAELGWRVAQEASSSSH